MRCGDSMTDLEKRQACELAIWQEIDSLVDISIACTDKELLSLHDDLVALHAKYTTKGDGGYSLAGFAY